jgi:hypothetical protein
MDNIANQLMQMFIMKDFIASNKYLPINPCRQAWEDYRDNPIVQQRVNSVVGEILEIIHTEKN